MIANMKIKSNTAFAIASVFASTVLSLQDFAKTRTKWRNKFHQ